MTEQRIAYALGTIAGLLIVMAILWWGVPWPMSYGPAMDRELSKMDTVVTKPNNVSALGAIPPPMTGVDGKEIVRGSQNTYFGYNAGLSEPPPPPCVQGETLLPGQNCTVTGVSQ